MKLLFSLIRQLLVTFTGHGYDRADWINALHHKLAYRLHKLLPRFGISGLQRVTTEALAGRYLRVRAEDGGVGHQFIMYRQYEPFESTLLQGLLRPGDIVYNIGANLGYYSVLSADVIGASGAVIAFEPAPDNYALLQQNIQENAIRTIDARPCAIGASDGEAMLALSTANSGDHQLRTAAGREHVSVPVRALDSLIADGALTPTVIILDVQGGELDVLRGASQLLQHAPPRFILTEFWPRGLDIRHPEGARTFLNLLVAAGYRFRRISERDRRVYDTNVEELMRMSRDVEEMNLLCEHL